MQNLDTPVWFRQAREEILLALAASDWREELAHRKLAVQFVSRAVREMQREPGREIDWKKLAARRLRPAWGLGRGRFDGGTGEIT